MSYLHYDPETGDYKEMPAPQEVPQSYYAFKAVVWMFLLGMLLAGAIKVSENIRRSYPTCCEIGSCCPQKQLEESVHIDNSQ